MSGVETRKFEPDFVFIKSTSASGAASSPQANGFQWPDEAGEMVECDDWNPEPVCGGGLHGLASGIGDWGLVASPTAAARWYICEAMRCEAVWIDVTKVKVPRCRVTYVGGFSGAMELITPKMSEEVQRLVEETTACATAEEGAHATGDGGASSATGNRGASSATGYGGASSATGYGGASSATGYGGASSATGYGGASSATGYGGASSATGYGGASSATGNGGASSATGYGGASSATGYGGASSATGYGGASSATGNGGASSATGYGGASSATGDGGASSATGNRGASSATGDGGASSATGKHGVALAAGHESRGMVENGSLLVLVERDPEDGEIVHYFAAREGEKGIEAGHWYTLKDGELVCLGVDP